MIETLTRTAEILDEKGIDYRVIGSHALHLYGREGSLNDIDLIVPRRELRSIPEVRQKLRREFGIAGIIGTYPGMRVIDFSEHSSLTHRDLRVDLDDSTMEEVEIDGVKTLSPESLEGMYGTIGIDRNRDADSRRFLSDLSTRETDPAFGEFKKLRSEQYPLYRTLRTMKEMLITPVPKNLKLVAQDAIESRIESRYEH